MPRREEMIQTHVIRVSPDLDLWMMLCRLSYSAAAVLINYKIKPGNHSSLLFVARFSWRKRDLFEAGRLIGREATLMFGNPAAKKDAEAAAQSGSDAKQIKLEKSAKYWGGAVERGRLEHTSHKQISLPTIHSGTLHNCNFFGHITSKSTS